MASLEVLHPERAVAVPVLEAGAGGITLCSVHVRVGPRVGIMDEPRSEESIRADLFDFAEFLRRDVTEPGESDDESGRHASRAFPVRSSVRSVT